MSHPPAPPPTDRDALLAGAIPEARRIAREQARTWRDLSPSDIEDAEQVACAALVASYPSFAPARGIPLHVYAFKRIVGELRRHFGRENAVRRVGLDDLLDDAEALTDAAEPIPVADDAGALALLQSQCRTLTLARIVGDTRAHLVLWPDDELARARAIAALREALGGLAPIEERLIHLRWWGDLSWSKVGAEIGLTEKQAQRLDVDLRARLLQDLRARGVPEAPPVPER